MLFIDVFVHILCFTNSFSLILYMNCLFTFCILSLLQSQTLYCLEKIHLSCKLTLNLLNFLNGIINIPVLELPIIIFRNIKMRTWKLFSNQYRAWSGCTDVHAGPALYWWQWLFTFCSNRIRVKCCLINCRVLLSRVESEKGLSSSILIYT